MSFESDAMRELEQRVRRLKEGGVDIEIVNKEINLCCMRVGPYETRGRVLASRMLHYLDGFDMALRWARTTTQIPNR